MIPTTLQKLETPKVNEHEKSNVRYYMEEHGNLTTIDVNGQTKMIYDLIADACKPTIEVQQVHHPIVAAQEPISFANLLSLPHLPTRKTRRKNPLMDYSQSYLVTSSEYFNILQKKNLKL